MHADPLTHFKLTACGDGCERWQRADGYAIDWFAIPPTGGPVAVLVAPEGHVVEWFDNLDMAALYADLITQAVQA